MFIPIFGNILPMRFNNRSLGFNHYQIGLERIKLSVKLIHRHPAVDPIQPENLMPMLF